MVAVLSPFAWPRRAEAAQAWREHRGKVLLVALLGPVGYILILYAMTFTPVSYIAPAPVAHLQSHLALRLGK